MGNWWCFCSKQLPAFGLMYSISGAMRERSFETLSNELFTSYYRRQSVHHNMYRVRLYETDFTKRFMKQCLGRTLKSKNRNYSILNSDLQRQPKVAK